MGLCCTSTPSLCLHKYNIIIYSFTAIGLSPGGSGYFTCIQNMKSVTTRFKSGGLHEKDAVAIHHEVNFSLHFISDPCATFPAPPFEKPHNIWRRLIFYRVRFRFHINKPRPPANRRSTTRHYATALAYASSFWRHPFQCLGKHLPVCVSNEYVRLHWRAWRHEQWNHVNSPKLKSRGIWRSVVGSVQLFFLELLTVKAIGSFQTLQTTRRKTRRHIP